jgi:ring-1,2-phenylacetyl-CoA epoxidase subunit PaaC
MNKQEAILEYTLRIADDSLLLGHRISEWCGHGPILEEDIALTNIALDLIGQATNFFDYAAKVQNQGKTCDDLAFLRLEREYKNVLLVEQKNGHFGDTMARQFFFDVFRKLFFEALSKSADQDLAAIAEKSLKETRYHLKHSSEWIIRLGDGTQESHDKIQESVDYLWKFTDELFFMDQVDELLIKENIAIDLESIRGAWKSYISEIFQEATLTIPTNGWQQAGGRKGLHSEHMGYALAELQYMQRAYPNMQW